MGGPGAPRASGPPIVAQPPPRPIASVRGYTQEFFLANSISSSA